MVNLLTCDPTGLGLEPTAYLSLSTANSALCHFAGIVLFGYSACGINVLCQLY